MRFSNGLRHTVIITVFLSGSQSLAQEHDALAIKRFNFHMENDVVAQTDSQYSAGGKISALYDIRSDVDKWLKLPLIHDEHRSQMISLTLAQQIYTPEDKENSELIPDDRPYAGWLYLEAGRHQASDRHLDSLSLAVGIVGPASGGEAVQDGFHKLAGKTMSQGWGHQLDNEPGIMLNYQHKWRFEPETIGGIENDITPFIGGCIGNVHTDLTVGTTVRIGRNIPKDFGSTSIDVGGESGIPTHTENIRPASLSTWGMLFHLTLAGSAVARNIFLDGNTFGDSHSVEKRPFVGLLGFGACVRYKNFILNYTHLQYTKQYTTEPTHHQIGTLVFSYLY